MQIAPYDLSIRPIRLQRFNIRSKKKQKLKILKIFFAIIPGFNIFRVSSCFDNNRPFSPRPFAFIHAQCPTKTNFISNSHCVQSSPLRVCALRRSKTREGWGIYIVLTSEQSHGVSSVLWWQWRLALCFNVYVFFNEHWVNSRW